MTAVKVKVPPKLIPVFLGEARYRGAFGGRGSAKTRTFAKMTAIRAYQWAMAGDSGVIVCAREFMNSLDESSMAEVKAAIASEPWLAAAFEVGEKYIRTASSLPGRIEYKFSGLDRNIDSIKSKAKIKILWVDEAEPVSETAWLTAIPSVREHDSEIWVTWNPKSKRSATHKRFREQMPDGAKIVELNWRDNPWFPAVLEMERLQDLAKRPDSYSHIWEGDFEQVVSGAYYAQSLAMARQQGRIKPLSVDPLMEVWTFWDIGTRDHTAIWCVQFVGGRVHCIDHYEAAGQPLATHLQWLRDNGYEKAICILPHDGANVNHISAERFVDHIRSAGFRAEVIANQGKGAAMQRVEAARRMFPSVYIDPEHCEGGLEALGAYHAKIDDKRGIDLGPDHDWSSHSCFVPETLILTRQGKVRIDSLPETGEILTPCGWKQYIHPRMTRANAPLVEVVFSDGHSVKCTPDHLFLTASGWRSAQSLEKGSEIQCSLTQQHGISKADYTGFGLAKNIFRAVGKSCIEKFGNLHSGKYQRNAISITKTALQVTIFSKILSAWMGKSILSTLGQIVRRLHIRRTSISLTSLELVLVTGISQKKVESGIGKKCFGKKHGRNGSVSLGHVTIVEKNTLLSFVQTSLASIAQLPAKLAHIAQAEGQMNSPLFIESVKRLNERRDVWDITVPDGHMFSLANGAVVHNCDAFGAIAIGKAHFIDAPQFDDEWEAPQRHMSHSATGY